MLRSIAFTLLTVVLFLLGPGSSYAEEKSYPGTFCVGDGNPGSSGITYSEGNRAENSASTRQVINCPIVRGNQTEGISWVRIYFRDNHASDHVDCELQSKDVTGSTVSSTDASSTGAFIGNTSLLLWGPPEHVVGGHYVVVCDLPGKASGSKSYIQSYVVSELPE